MPSYFRHIVHFLLVVLVVMGGASCTSWREGKAVVAEADRLLVKGVIIKDTAALSGGICTLENLMGRVFAKEELTKMYYLMGRNLDDYYHNFSDAADFYIQADRMKTKDWVLRGRINSCMGFICKQDSSFAEALEFYERANNAFEKTGDKRRVANGLVSIAEQYVNLKDYSKADSVLNIAAGYDIDSAYYARVVDVRALALFNQQLYDSALVYLLSIENYPRNIEARCYSYLHTMRIYEITNHLFKTNKYAEYIIAHSTNSNHRSNAYYYLMVLGDKNNDISRLSIYSHAREDENRIVRQYAESYAQASDKLKIYLENPYPHRRLYIIIVCSALVVILLFGIIYGLIKRHRCVLVKRDKEKQDRCDLLARRIYDHSVYFTSWQDYKKLRELANSHFNNMFYRLEDTYHLSEQELKICLMILLEYTNKQMAEILFVQPNTISKAKNKIAKQLNTSSAQLRASLIDILA